VNELERKRENTEKEKTMKNWLVYPVIEPQENSRLSHCRLRACGWPDYGPMEGRNYIFSQFLSRVA